MPTTAAPTRITDRLASADPSSLRPLLGWWWLVSLALHGVLFVALLILFTQPPIVGLPNPEPTMEVSIVMQSDTPTATVFETAEDKWEEPIPADTPPVPDAMPLLDQSPLPPVTTTDLPPLPQNLDLPPIPMPELPLDPAVLGVASASPAETGAPATPAGLPAPARASSGPTVRTRFFDAEAVGNSFVFVIDRSASMAHLNALELAKGEMLRSLSALTSEHQFQVIFYNDVTSRLTLAGGQLASANDSNIKSADRILRTITPDGGTNHNAALLEALALEPAVIYFLTDADNMTEADVRVLTAANRKLSRLASIHTIQFANGPADTQPSPLRSLALKNNGTHTHVNVITRSAGR